MVLDDGLVVSLGLGLSIVLVYKNGEVGAGISSRRHTESA